MVVANQEFSDVLFLGLPAKMKNGRTSPQVWTAQGSETGRITTGIVKHQKFRRIVPLCRFQLWIFSVQIGRLSCPLDSSNTWRKPISMCFRFFKYNINMLKMVQECSRDLLPPSLSLWSKKSRKMEEVPQVYLITNPGSRFISWHHFSWCNGERRTNVSRPSPSWIHTLHKSALGT